MVLPRRKGTDLIDDERKRKKTQSTRSEGLVKRAKDNHSLTHVPVAVITFNAKDELCSFGSPSVEEAFLMYLRKKYDPKLQVSPKEWLDWAKKECDSRKTKEDCTSLIMKYQVVLNCLCEKLKDLENNPSVNAGAGHESGVGAGRDPSPLASTEDGDDHDISLTSPDSATTDSESAAGNFNSMLDAVELAFNSINESMTDPDLLEELWSCSDPKGHENNADHYGL